MALQFGRRLSCNAAETPYELQNCKKILTDLASSRLCEIFCHDVSCDFETVPRHIVIYFRMEFYITSAARVKKFGFVIQSRDHSGDALSQWEMTLQCNVISHWLSPCPEWLLQRHWILWFKICMTHSRNFNPSFDSVRLIYPYMRQ